MKKPKSGYPSKGTYVIWEAYPGIIGVVLGVKGVDIIILYDVGEKFLAHYREVKIVEKKVQWVDVENGDVVYEY